MDAQIHFSNETDVPNDGQNCVDPADPITSTRAFDRPWEPAGFVQVLGGGGTYYSAPHRQEGSKPRSLTNDYSYGHVLNYVLPVSLRSSIKENLCISIGVGLRASLDAGQVSPARLLSADSWVSYGSSSAIHDCDEGEQGIR